MKLTIEEFVKRDCCGAKTRAGTPCKRRDFYLNGRCKLHGGLSTGPKTLEGKKRSAQTKDSKCWPYEVHGAWGKVGNFTKISLPQENILFLGLLDLKLR